MFKHNAKSIFNVRRRPSASRVLAHPFLSGKKAARMVGEEAAFDVFLSYRVKSDADHASQLYRLLSGVGVRVWQDIHCLEAGLDWEEGFCDGLVKSRIFVTLMSRQAVASYATLEEESLIDNVLLEQTLALELEKMGLVEKIYPVLVGDKLADGSYSSYFQSGCSPKCTNVVVKSVMSKVKDHLERQGLGTPLNESPTPSSVMKEILNHQAGFVVGERNQSMEKVAQVL